MLRGSSADGFCRIFFSPSPSAVFQAITSLENNPIGGIRTLCIRPLSLPLSLSLYLSLPLPLCPSLRFACSIKHSRSADRNLFNRTATPDGPQRRRLFRWREARRAADLVYYVCTNFAGSFFEMEGHCFYFDATGLTKVIPACVYADGNKQRCRDRMAYEVRRHARGCWDITFFVYQPRIPLFPARCLADEPRVDPPSSIPLGIKVIYCTIACLGINFLAQPSPPSGEKVEDVGRPWNLSIKKF